MFSVAFSLQFCEILLKPYLQTEFQFSLIISHFCFVCTKTMLQNKNNSPLEFARDFCTLMRIIICIWDDDYFFCRCVILLLDPHQGDKRGKIEPYEYAKELMNFFLIKLFRTFSYLVINIFWPSAYNPFLQNLM